jgi:putative membrane-bound dehydrogenase-like protein
MKPQLLLTLFFTTSALAMDGWESRRLLSDFHAEGAGIGDIDGDGNADLIYGPFWFAGPEFQKQHRFTEGEDYSPNGYSDNFFSFIQDLTGDGRNDLVVFGFPGKEVRLFVNPGTGGWDKTWPVHVIVDQLCHEAPSLVDLIPGGLPEIVGARDTAYGYYAAGADVTKPWTWHAISAAGRAEKPFGHGMGVGDVNGDGRLDVIEKVDWYEQPTKPSEPWTEHRWAVLPTDGAQILVNDVDGDGDNDFISSLRAHGTGIAWFEQAEPGKFVRHDIIGASSTDNPFGVTFTEPHGLALADMDGDGRKDFVSGKRWFSHGPRDPGALQEPVVYWFRNVKTADGIEFVPHFVDNDSGIGVGVPVGDLNGDGRPDIVSANKRGLAIHFQTEDVLTGAAERWKVPGGRPMEDYGSGLAPQEALKKFVVPPGFSTDLIATEPQVTQPIAMCFDARGRLWVVEGHTYPERAPEGEGKDRVLILEDTDGDGTFDARKVFVEKLNLASGIQVGFGGVYIGAAPYLLFFADKNGDDLPDDEPEILLDGWGYQDTHETLNSFIWGPDGWLYGCHGVFTHSNVGKPGAGDAERQRINAGVWRFHPVRRVFEVFAAGSSNPWGLDFNAQGDAFITACVIPHLYHVVSGARYQRQGGQHFNPYTYDDIKTVADHLHYAGTDIRSNGVQVAGWQTKFNDSTSSAQPADLDTSALGGGHAHCGLAIYQADEFPSAYRGDLFFSNLHGHRIVRERLERDGSGLVGRHMPDFALAQDVHFIGVSVIQGPDGAIYVSDWHDRQRCHHRDVEAWDRSNGRIYRVRHGAARDPRLDLEKQTDAALVSTLAHPNVVHARLAQRLLQERVTFGKADAAALKTALGAFEKEHEGNVPLRLRAFWTAHSCGLQSTDDLIARLRDPNEHVRGWALQFLGEAKTALPAAALASVEKLVEDESSMITRRHAASLLQRLPLDQRWKIAASLIARSHDQFDRNLPLLVWYGVEPLVEADPARALALSETTAWPQLREFIARRATSIPAGREALMTALGAAPDEASFARRANQLLLALAQLPPVQRPAGWEKARAAGEKRGAKNPAVLDAVQRLGVRFGDADFFPQSRAVARNRETGTADRIEAIEMLRSGADPGLGALARELLDEEPLLPVVLRALRSAPGTETAQALVARIDRFPLELRNEAINLLATQPKMALVLLQAVDEKKLAPSLISPVLLDQFVRFKDPAITTLIDRHWTRGGGGVDLAQLTSAIQSWTTKLTPTVMAQADASRGRRVYQTTCGICHPLFGEGIVLGPDLTGSNRANLPYLLENVLAPSAVVGRDYLLNVVTQEDGTVVSGIIRAENPDFITLAMPGGTTTDVKKANVAKREELPASLMPAGLFDALPLNQVADLVKYLASPAQVPLPADAPATATAPVPAPAVVVPALARGGVLIEGEGLLPANAKATGGDLSTQSMANFSNGVWSGGRQLFWVNVELGDTLTLTLPSLAPGTHDLTFFFTLARDYGRFRITLNGATQEADLYSTDNTVRNAPPVTFRNVVVAKDQPLKIVIEPNGANPASKIGEYGFVFGLDRIEIVPLSEAKPGASVPVPASTPPNDETPAGALSFTAGGKEIMRFQMQSQKDSGVIVPSGAYFHPIRTPSGIEVTALAPKAHPYYRGLFMAFVDTQGKPPANFWGGGGGPTAGSVIVNKEVTSQTGATGEPTRFLTKNEWQRNGVTLIKEDVEAAIHLSGSATLLDLAYTLTAPEDLPLAHCNVGGLALPVRTDGTLTAHGPDGPVKLPGAAYRQNETNWPSSPWYGYTITLPDGAVVSAAILDHPANPETRWHCSTSARVINPCITTTREVILKAGVPLTLRYRVIAQDGAFDAKRMSELAGDFAGQKAK